jgi:hypothetical protein
MLHGLTRKKIVFQQTIKRKIYYPILLFLNFCQFVRHYKKLCLFPIFIMLGEGLLFGTAFFLLFQRIHHFHLAALSVKEASVYFLKWYDIVGLILYYSLYNILLKFFNFGLIIYLNNVLHTVENISVLKAIRESLLFWKYFIWDVCIGTPMVFFFNLFGNFSEKGWKHIESSFGGIKKNMAFFVLPVVALEQQSGFSALRRASALLRPHHKVQSGRILQLGFIDFLFFLPLIFCVYQLFLMTEVKSRIMVASVMVVYIISVTFFRLLMHVTLRTMAYFYISTGEKSAEFKAKLLENFIPMA